MGVVLPESELWSIIPPPIIPPPPMRWCPCGGGALLYSMDAPPAVFPEMEYPASDDAASLLLLLLLLLCPPPPMRPEERGVEDVPPVPVLTLPPPRRGVDIMRWICCTNQQQHTPTLLFLLAIYPRAVVMIDRLVDTNDKDKENERTVVLASVSSRSATVGLLSVFFHCRSFCFLGAPPCLAQLSRQMTINHAWLDSMSTSLLAGKLRLIKYQCHLSIEIFAPVETLPSN